MDANQDTCLGCQSAIAEAHALYRLVSDENTIEEPPELIGVPPRIRWALGAYAKAHPEEAHFVDRAVKFREAIALELEQLVREGGPKSDFRKSRWKCWVLPLR